MTHLMHAALWFSLAVIPGPTRWYAWFCGAINVGLHLWEARQIGRLRNRLSDLPLIGNEEELLTIVLDLYRLGASTPKSVALHVRFMADSQVCAFELRKIAGLKRTFDIDDDPPIQPH